MEPKDSNYLEIAAAISIITVFGLSLGLTVPVIALVLAESGYSSAAIGGHVSAQFLGLMLTSPLIPRLLVRFGTSNLIIFGVLTVALTMSCFAVLNGFLLWLVLRFCLGAAEAIIFVSADTWINQIASQQNRGRIIGLYAAAISAGLGLGTFLLTLTGTDGTQPFLLGSLIAFLTLPILLCTYNKPPKVELENSYSQWRLSVKAAVPLLFTMLFGILFATALGLLPVYGLSLSLAPETAAKLVGTFILGGVIFQLPIGFIADKIDRYNLMYGSALFSALALLLIIELWHVPVALFVLLFISGGLIGSFWTIPLMLFGDMFEGSDLASVNSISAILYGLGSTIGPSIVGVCMLWSPHGLMGAMALPTITLAGASLIYRFLCRQRS